MSECGRAPQPAVEPVGGSIGDSIGDLRRSFVDTPAGPVGVPAPAALVDGAGPTLRPVPALGADTEAVLAEFAEP